MANDFPSDVELPKVEIHATEVCNNRCTFCTTGWINGERGPELIHPPRELIRQQLETAYAQGARRALFQGGEPTIRRDLGDLLKDAHDIGYKVTTIFTNARMAASKPGARWMVGMNVTWFQVSIQGGTAEAHDASVDAKGAWAQTVAGTRRLIEMGQRVKVNGVLTKHLLETIDEFADLMIDLRPEEVGMDTIKPSSAFDVGREKYVNLMPLYSLHTEKLAKAVRRMDEAGIVARLTSFPPCLVPGAEHLVAEESGTTQTQQHKGNLVHKLSWKRSMQVKAPSCAECAYDSTCGGVYAPYAEIHGLSELKPLRERKVVERPARQVAREETPLTRALRALFVRGSQPTVGVRDVKRLSDGTHELEGFTPRGTIQVVVSTDLASPAYAKTDHFSVSYRKLADGSDPDPRFLDAVVRALKRAEADIHASPAAEPPPEVTA